jgi:hypothetical protein
LKLVDAKQREREQHNQRNQRAQHPRVLELEAERFACQRRRRAQHRVHRRHAERIQRAEPDALPNLPARLHTEKAQRDGNQRQHARRQVQRQPAHEQNQREPHPLPRAERLFQPADQPAGAAAVFHQPAASVFVGGLRRADCLVVLRVRRTLLVGDGHDNLDGLCARRIAGVVVARLVAQGRLDSQVALGRALVQRELEADGYASFVDFQRLALREGERLLDGLRVLHFADFVALARREFEFGGDEVVF